MRYFGLEGIRARLREHLRLARLFADWVDQDPGFERVAPVPFSVVCFRAVPGRTDGKRRGGGDGDRDAGDGVAAREALNAFNERLLNALNDTGEFFLSHTTLGDRYVSRLAIGNIRTTEADVRRCWERIRELAGSLRMGPPKGD